MQAGFTLSWMRADESDPGFCQRDRSGFVVNGVIPKRSMRMASVMAKPRGIGQQRYRRWRRDQ
jgi:hypothetical protein